MIRVTDLYLAPGGSPLLEDATWHLRPKEKVALVGRNGTGKSTLLAVLAGERDPEGGQVDRRNRLRIGTLPQQAVSGSQRTVWDEARSGMTRLLALQEALQRAEEQVALHAPGAVEQHADALEVFRQAGGFSADERIGEVLHGLGFAPEVWKRPCDTLSGGWQMRVALARVLLSEPDLAMLDEPTNHLDLAARSWLAGYLARAPFAVMVVSHDRHLLDRVPDRIVEIRAKRLHHFKGNFATWLAERDRRQAEAQTLYERQQEEVARLERFVERFKAKATKAAQARSRQNRLDRMDRLDAPDHFAPLPRLVLPEAPPGAQEIIDLRDVSLGWPGGSQVLSGVNLLLERGMRTVVLGPNGSGKSTLLHALAGRLAPLSGRRRLGDRARIGLFSQDLAAELPPEFTALEYVTGLAPMRTPQQVRSVLGALGLSGNDALRPIGQLSGGEKARVALAALAVKPSNVLLLDEPTNHLDAETVEVLVRALRRFEGALFLVTHDRYLVEALATHVVRVVGGTATLTEGVRPSDLEAAPTQRRLAAVQEEIEQAESELKRIDEALFANASDYDKARRLGEERDEVQTRHDALFEEWEALEEKLG
jgi:ATP-binding cassette subfamily F protein 3